jgi:hypothetical protein
MQQIWTQTQNCRIHEHGNENDGLKFGTTGKRKNNTRVEQACRRRALWLCPLNDIHKDDKCSTYEIENTWWVACMVKPK